MEIKPICWTCDTPKKAVYLKTDVIKYLRSIGVKENELELNFKTNWLSNRMVVILDNDLLLQEKIYTSTFEGTELPDQEDEFTKFLNLEYVSKLLNRDEED